MRKEKNSKIPNNGNGNRSPRWPSLSFSCDHVQEETGKNTLPSVIESNEIEYLEGRRNKVIMKKSKAIGVSSSFQ